VTKQDQSRHLVIGLDGATLDLIGPWAQAGYLPHLAHIMQAGCHGVMRSTIPVHSPTAWSSFMTGTNPGKHGVFDFVKRQPNSYRLRVVRSSNIRGPSLWQLLSHYGHRVAVMNVPMTYPPQPVNGFMVSGLGTPDYKPFTYPPDMSDDLRARGYRVNKEKFYHPADKEAWLADIYDTSEKRARIALELMAEHEWDFFMLVFRNTDELAHFFWSYMDPSHPEHDPNADERYRRAILEYYQRVDEWIGQLVEAAGPNTNVFIVSDHGAGPLYKDVFLNEWLIQKGWLTLKKASLPGKMISGVARRLGLTRANISSTLSALHLHCLEVVIKTVLGDRIEILPRDRRPEFVNAIDWSKTKAYSFGYYGQIFINLEGREPQGIIAPGKEYENLRNEIIQELLRLKDPEDGLPVVDQVLKREELFEGPHVSDAPDLLTIMRGLSYMTRKGYEFSEERGRIFRRPYTYESGSHRLEGILLACGPHITSGKKLADVKISDFAPTLLYLSDCPIPPEMDGRVLTEMISPQYALQHQVVIKSPEAVEKQVDAGWEPDEEEEIKERLRGLGYLG
jgi:predicted AlkP superfamily phosphohydrolase/phosphomutase